MENLEEPDFGQDEAPDSFDPMEIEEGSLEGSLPYGLTILSLFTFYGLLCCGSTELAQGFATAFIAVLGAFSIWEYLSILLVAKNKSRGGGRTHRRMKHGDRAEAVQLDYVAGLAYATMAVCFYSALGMFALNVRPWSMWTVNLISSIWYKIPSLPDDSLSLAFAWITSMWTLVPWTVNLISSGTLLAQGLIINLISSVTLLAQVLIITLSIVLWIGVNIIFSIGKNLENCWSIASWTFNWIWAIWAKALAWMTAWIPLENILWFYWFLVAIDTFGLWGGWEVDTRIYANLVLMMICFLWVLIWYFGMLWELLKLACYLWEHEVQIVAIVVLMMSSIFLLLIFAYVELFEIFWELIDLAWHWILQPVLLFYASAYGWYQD